MIVRASTTDAGDDKKILLTPRFSEVIKEVLMIANRFNGNDILDASTPKAFANFSSGLRFGNPEGPLTYGFATLKELPRVSLSQTVATPSELRANIATLTQGFKANPGL